MRKFLTAAAFTAAALLASAPAFAQWYGPEVGVGVGPGPGPGYGYGYGYGYGDGGYGPGYDDGGYGPGYGGGYAVPANPVYEGRSVAVDPNSAGGSVAYCESHFRSYNPATGMYLGFDGQYHPCP